MSIAIIVSIITDICGIAYIEDVLGIQNISLVVVMCLDGLSQMDLIPIAEISPNIPSGQIRAIVMIKWPYSTSRNEMAVVLAEPSLRLRRVNGQVKVRFTNSSALSLAMTDITIGDEVLLSLQGAVVEWKSQIEKIKRGVGFGLCYTKDVVVRVLRNGVEIAAINTSVDKSPDVLSLLDEMAGQQTKSAVPTSSKDVPAWMC
ncbi:hypothetical protein PSV08DRAFT_355028 [Bipolaris maydis]|uniref:uncharacterized protein n=1 Tax=Cochliobolus heterostrophus TaxID=5016 RepID=UPI0024D67952|nr:hypothetical protein PSV08DRAFT_355028 [Bipolaris maydis]